MGGGSFSEHEYVRSTVTRKASGVDDFEYTKHATKVHDSLDPKRIKDKPFGKLESRDSVEHPISTPVIITFDVTGSNYDNAKVAQKKLPELMAKLASVCENPQIAVWANDDYLTSGKAAVQLGDFESDNRIDDGIRNTWLVGAGGGNDGESYDLLIYAAARKTVTDSMEKRNKKGYMFLYADEPFFLNVDATQISRVFGDKAQSDLKLTDLITETQKSWDIYVIWPQDGYKHSRLQYVELFGDSSVVTLQDPSLLCEKVASIISQREEEYKSNAHEATIDMTEELHARVE